MKLEVKKHALRQTQDGEWHVTIKVNPFDDCEALLRAPMGARFYTEWTEVDENEEPVERAAAPQVITPAAPASPEPEPPGRSEVAPEKRLAQQAGILCGDPVFKRFLAEMSLMHFDETPEEAIRDYCRVESRAEIVPGTGAAARWDSLVGQFEYWKSA